MLCLVSCQQHKKTKIETSEKNINTDTIATMPAPPGDKAEPKEPALASFIDSVANKYVLTLTQILACTKLGSIHDSEYLSSAVFTGDTVVNFGTGFKGAIIEYNDKKNCIFKFLFVFGRVDNLNTDIATIFKGCDIDQDSGGTMLDYKLLTDSTFQTIETDILPDLAENSDTKKEIFNWKINGQGIIDSMPKNVNNK